MRLTDPDRVFSARQKRRVEACAIVARAIEAAQDSRPVVAARMDIAPTELGRLVDPTSGRMFPLEHALALDVGAYRVLLEQLASRTGLAVVELPSAASTTDDLRALAVAQRETAEAIAHGLDAMADGHMTRTEGARVEKECDEAIAALLVIRERARLAQREGVIGLRAATGAMSGGAR